MLEALTGARVGSFSWFGDLHTRALALSFSPDSRVVAASTTCGRCMVWDMGDLPKPTSHVGQSAASAAGVYTGGPLVRLVDTTAATASDTQVVQLLFSPDARWLLCLTQRGSVMNLWDVQGAARDGQEGT